MAKKKKVTKKTRKPQDSTLRNVRAADTRLDTLEEWQDSVTNELKHIADELTGVNERLDAIEKKTKRKW